MIRPQGENWTGLRHLVEADKAVPAREKVLALLDEENDTEQLKILLRHLNGGKTYRYISGRLLPDVYKRQFPEVRKMYVTILLWGIPVKTEI